MKNLSMHSGKFVLFFTTKKIDYHGNVKNRMLCDQKNQKENNFAFDEINAAV
jgi:hypothetical protein